MYRLYILRKSLDKCNAMQQVNPWYLHSVQVRYLYIFYFIALLTFTTEYLAALPITIGNF